MFISCSNLISLPPLNFNNANNLYHIVYNCPSLSNLSICNLVNSLPYQNQMEAMNDNSSLSYLGLTSSQKNSLPEAIKDYAIAKGWNV